MQVVDVLCVVEVVRKHGTDEKRPTVLYFEWLRLVSCANICGYPRLGKASHQSAYTLKRERGGVEESLSYNTRLTVYVCVYVCVSKGLDEILRSTSSDFH